MRKTFLRVAIAACISLGLAFSAAAAPQVQSLLPAKDAVKGWSVMPGSLQYGKGDDIAKIYNGGYELYTNNGVVDAARQMYQRGGDYVEITIHTMKSDKAASDFLKYWKKQFKATAMSKSIRSANFFIQKLSVARYFVTGKYFTTVVAFHDVKKAAGDTQAFMVAIDKSIGAATKKGSKR
jgi:hypothetical protein